MKSIKLDTYTIMCTELFNSIKQSVGIHVLLLIIEYSLLQIKQNHEEAALIQFSEEGIFLDKLDNIDLEEADLILSDFITTINSTLKRLGEGQITEQIIQSMINLK